MLVLILLTQDIPPSYQNLLIGPTHLALPTLLALLYLLTLLILIGWGENSMGSVESSAGEETNSFEQSRERERRDQRPESRGGRGGSWLNAAATNFYDPLQSLAGNIDASSGQESRDPRAESTDTRAESREQRTERDQRGENRGSREGGDSLESLSSMFLALQEQVRTETAGKLYICSAG
jgi:hypothetical protein